MRQFTRPWRVWLTRVLLACMYMAGAQPLAASGRTPAIAAPDYGLGAGGIVFAEGFEALVVELIVVGAGPFPLPQDSPAVQVDGVGRNGGGISFATSGLSRTATCGFPTTAKARSRRSTSRQVLKSRATPA